MTRHDTQQPQQFKPNRYQKSIYTLSTTCKLKRYFEFHLLRLDVANLSQDSVPVTQLKVTNDLSAGKPDLKQCHSDVLNVNFPLVCREAGKAAEVLVAASYFWRGYQRPSGIGLSDRTSVALDPPLTHLGQAFLSVSRHRPPAHHISLPLSLSPSLGYDSWPALGMGGCAEVCACMIVCSGVSVGLGAGLREKSAPGRCGRQRVGQSSLRGP